MTAGSRDTLPETAEVADGRCITCADTAIWMRVVEVDVSRAQAECADPADARETVDTGLFDTVLAGDSLLVHAGAALQRRPRADTGTARGSR